MDKDIRREITQVKEYIEKWGPDVPLYELLNLVKGQYKHECPICKGNPSSNACKLCNGLGYTTIKYVPRMIQDGWIDESDTSDILRLINKYK